MKKGTNATADALLSNHPADYGAYRPQISEADVMMRDTRP